MKARVTGPQLAAVGFLSLLSLAGGVLIPANRVNLSLSARDVGGLIMPPGMIMPRDTPAEAMQDMAAVDPGAVSYTAPATARGHQLLEPRLEGGVKVFDLATSVIEWNILPNEQLTAYAVNRQVPGPRIELEQGDRVRFNVTNNLPESTTPFTGTASSCPTRWTARPRLRDTIESWQERRRQAWYQIPTTQASTGAFWRA